MKIDEWTNCYPSNWKGVIVPEAMSHPAKFSSKLIQHIYEHLRDEGWIQPGDSVIDPFGGVALGALHAMLAGLNWYGVELEEKFFKLGNQNIEKWQKDFRTMPRLGSAQLFHGDSRHLIEVLKANGVTVSVSSPPYADGSQHTGGDDTHPEFVQGGEIHLPGIAGAISPPPYAESLNAGKGGIDWEKAGRPDRLTTDAVGIQGANDREERYGSTPGQLGAMKADGFDIAITSQPFLQSEGGHPEPKLGGVIDEAMYARHAAGNKASNAYGDSEGQLSSMKDGSFDMAISSSPYSGMEVEKNSKSIDRTKQYEIYKKSGGGQTFEAFCHTQDIHSQGYGTSEGQLANMPEGNFDAALSSPPYDEARIGKESGQEHCGHGDQYGIDDGQLGGSDDFWLAARQIVEQVYIALRPGGHAVWVCKDYVKNKERVPFSDQWRQLCEAVGFETLHEHHALLVRNKRTQIDLEGNHHELQSESKSFFRRLAEKKGSPRIDFEVVYCMVKPEGKTK